MQATGYGPAPGQGNAAAVPALPDKITVQCPHCGAHFETPGANYGKVIWCKECHKRVVCKLPAHATPGIPAGNVPVPGYGYPPGTASGAGFRPQQPPRTAAPVVLGILSMILSFIPIVGFILAICGLVSASKQKRGGCIALCVIGLILSVIFSIIGAIQGAQQYGYSQPSYRSSSYNSYYYGY